MEIFSYFIYYTTVVLATIFAGFAQKLSYVDKLGRTKPNRFLTLISMSFLIYIMGFRDYLSVGVDGYSYYQGYLKANSMDIISYYATNVTEPGFYLLYRMAYFLGDPQWLFVLSAFITIIFFYKSLSYEVNRVNFMLAVFIFSTTQYFYYFGIMRMGIAVSIIAFSYRYLIENKNKRFIISVIVACMFHYSALFALIFLFLSKDTNSMFKKQNLYKFIFLIPSAFLFIRYIVYPLITINRYQGYIESSGIFSSSFIMSLPLLGLFAFHYNKFRKSYSNNYSFYFFLFVINVVTEVFSPLIGIGRMVWYVNLSICFLFPATVRLNKDKGKKVAILLITIIYCIVYSFYAYFGDSPRGETMIPYKNIIWP